MTFFQAFLMGGKRLTYTIKKHTVNAKPNTTALRYARNGIVWKGRFRLDKRASHLPQLPPVSVPRTHIKLAGLYWSGWNVWPRMREAWKAKKNAYEGHASKGYVYGQCARAALKQLPAWTHTNSIRLIAKWEERSVRQERPEQPYEATRGVSISTYVYLDGKGATTSGSPVAGQEIAWLPDAGDGWTVEGEVPMVYTHGNVWVGQDLETEQHIPITYRPWFFGLCKAHAANGPSSPNAPCDLKWVAETERL